jgi:hypothetical protein
MPVYQPGIPTGTVNLNVDYLNLQGNFQQANIVYGTDHYPFDNATPNLGFHNTVTTPPVVNSPPTGLPPVTAANPIFYAYQQYAALGVLQYSRGPDADAPTPLTHLNSASPITPPIAPLDFVDVLDFTGLGLVFAVLYAGDSGIGGNSRLMAFIFWTGTAGFITNIVGGASLAPSFAGNVLRIQNGSSVATASAAYWTLQLIRVQ